MSVFRIDTTNVPNNMPSPIAIGQEDDLSNLMAIPVAKEIAPDFTLFGYNKMIRRIEEVLVQRGLQRNVMLYGDRGSGKEHPYSLIVPTPQGNRHWGDLQVGDQLFGLSGDPVRIKRRHEQGVKPIYRISFDDDSSTLAGLDHLWYIRDHRKQRHFDWKVLSTASLIEEGIFHIDRGWRSHHWELPISQPVQYERQDVPIDPYVLGVWLGDGKIGTDKYYKPDIEIVNRIRSIYEVEERPNGGEGRCPCWKILGISQHLRSLGLWKCHSYERFVPESYLNNNVTNRLELLRGIMDTDGWVDPNGAVCFASSSEILADNVAWLVRSLGGKAHVSAKKAGYVNDQNKYIECRDSHVVSISVPLQVFHLPRKATVTTQQVHTRYLARWIDSIDYDHDEDAMCVTVDSPDNLYLVNDFIPTHNTAIVHGLVQRKNNNDLSTHMYKRTFYRLNNSRLLHTLDVVEISRQFDQVLLEFGPYDTLVIEGFYTLMSYLKLRGATMVLVGLLEALSLRRMQTIITCETREKSLILNEIPETHEYFVPERVVEPTNDELLNILRGVHPSYEARYGIGITDDAICMLRDLTQKYRNGMEGWAQPGRALLVMDRSIASFSVRMNSKPVELTDLESEERTIINEIESVGPNGKRKRLESRLEEIQPKIITLREEWEQTTAPIRKLQAEKSDYEIRRHRHIVERKQLEALRHDTVAMVSQGKDPTTLAEDIQQLSKMVEIAAGNIRRIDQDMAKINLSDQRDHTVTKEFVAETFSEISGIPPSQLTANERSRVLHMEEILAEKVFGQTEGIKSVSDAIRRARAGLSDNKSKRNANENEKNEGPPKGSFLFLGPSGVGKTQLGKALAEFEKVKLVRIDMSEFMEAHSVAKLIGAPPGYAGHDEGGVLTKAVHDFPTAVVMLDEIEKAHADISKLLLQVLSDGRLTDGFGETTNFSETLIILTSNAGGSYFTDTNLTYEQASQLAMKKVDEFLLPEIRGRLDSIVCFHRLDLSMLVLVTKQRLQEIDRGLQENHDATIEVSDSDIEQFCRSYQDDRYGGRKMLTSLKQTLEGTLALEILKETNGSGVYHAKFNGTTFDVQFVPKAATQ